MARTKCLRVTLTAVQTLVAFTSRALGGSARSQLVRHTMIIHFLFFLIYTTTTTVVLYCFVAVVDCEQNQGTTENDTKKHTRGMRFNLRGRKASLTVMFCPAYTIRHPDITNVQLIKHPIIHQQIPNKSNNGLAPNIINQSNSSLNAR